VAFCANCGAALTQANGFCGSCGKPVGAATQPAAVQAAAPTMQAAAAAPVMQPVAVSGPAPATASGLTSNVAGALAYILGFITGIIFLVIEPYKHDRFVRFHAMQSILYSAAGIVFRVGWGILVSALMSVSAWIGLLLVPVGLVISIALFGFWIFLMYQAYSQREFYIPIIGAIAAKQVG
jgi:uncharacterized membrane protein